MDSVLAKYGQCVEIELLFASYVCQTALMFNFCLAKDANKSCMFTYFLHIKNRFHFRTNFVLNPSKVSKLAMELMPSKRSETKVLQHFLFTLPNTSYASQSVE